MSTGVWKENFALIESNVFVKCTDEMIHYLDIHGIMLIFFRVSLIIVHLFWKKGKGVYGIFNFITFHLTCECYFQTVLLADILPTLIIKITAPFYMQRIPYRWDKDQIYYHLL